MGKRYNIVTTDCLISCIECTGKPAVGGINGLMIPPLTDLPGHVVVKDSSNILRFHYQRDDEAGVGRCRLVVHDDGAGRLAKLHTHIVGRDEIEHLAEIVVAHTNLVTIGKVAGVLDIGERKILLCLMIEVEVDGREVELALLTRERHHARGDTGHDCHT